MFGSVFWRFWSSQGVLALNVRVPTITGSLVTDGVSW